MKYWSKDDDHYSEAYQLKREKEVNLKVFQLLKWIYFNAMVVIISYTVTTDLTSGQDPGGWHITWHLRKPQHEIPPPPPPIMHDSLHYFKMKTYNVDIFIMQHFPNYPP